MAAGQAENSTVNWGSNIIKLINYTIIKAVIICILKKKLRTANPFSAESAQLPTVRFNGNGDLAVILGNSPPGMRIYISKCDLWYASKTFKKGGIKPL